MGLCKECGLDDNLVAILDQLQADAEKWHDAADQWATVVKERDQELEWCRKDLAACQKERDELQKDSDYYEHNRNVMNGAWLKLREENMRLILENEDQQKVIGVYERCESTVKFKRELAAKDAQIAKLRDCLERYCDDKCNAEYNPCEARKALSLPTDDTALKQAIAKELRRMADAFVNGEISYRAVTVRDHILRRVDELEGR